jgi:isopentenyl-diphosphate delta-isomerase
MGESNLEAGHRRLQEEMGMRTDLRELFNFIYKAPFDNGLTEHELDHVLLGYSDTDPVINPEEVATFRWASLEAIAVDMTEQPQQYTEWFKIIFDRFYTHVQSLKSKN